MGLLTGYLTRTIVGGAFLVLIVLLSLALLFEFIGSISKESCGSLSKA